MQTDFKLVVVSIRRCGITAVNHMFAFNVVILAPDTQQVHEL